MLLKILLPIAAAVVAASALPTATAQCLQSWQLTELGTFSPSGRPGNSPYSTLNATIQDPNTIPVAQTPTGQAAFPPSSASCSAQWITSPPWGEPIACSSNSEFSSWSFTINQGTSGTTNFTLEFKLIDDVIVLGTRYTKTFAGGDHFEVGTNLGGSCGGSGVCSWGLNSSPYKIKQKAEK